MYAFGMESPFVGRSDLRGVTGPPFPPPLCFSPRRTLLRRLKVVARGTNPARYHTHDARLFLSNTAYFANILPKRRRRTSRENRARPAYVFVRLTDSFTRETTPTASPVRCRLLRVFYGRERVRALGGRQGVGAQTAM